MFIVFEELVYYQSVVSLSSWFNFGFLSGFSIAIQVITGFFLACYYDSNSEFAYDSLQFVVRELNFMWCTRFVHANMASATFLYIYLHIAKALLNMAYRSYKELMWLLGILILFLLLAIGFSGYSLVWGQMSYWALTVITNIITVVPVYGPDLLEFIWGNTVLTTYSLRRFFCFHFIAPFIVLFLVILHLLVGHRSYTNHYMNIHTADFDRVSFLVGGMSKDIYFFWNTMIIVMFVVLLNTNMLIHPDNYLYAMAYVTPVHIEPEWYFLPYYALLRSMPHKLTGALFLVFGVFVFGIFTIVASYDRALLSLSKGIIITFIVNFCYLGYLATCPMAFPYIDFTLMLVWIHFYLLILIV